MYYYVIVKLYLSLNSIHRLSSIISDQIHIRLFTPERCLLA